MLIRKKRIKAEDSSHIIMQHTTPFLVLLLVSAFCHTAEAKVGRIIKILASNNQLLKCNESF